MIPFGFEPKTYCLEGSCSIQLSYGTKIQLLSCCLEGSCFRRGGLSYGTYISIQLLVCRKPMKAEASGPKKKGMIAHPQCRGGRIRTCDLLVPNQAR